MSYINVLKGVPEAMSQPAGIAALASLGIHGAIAFLLPLMPVDSAKSTKQASITKPVDVSELTPSEQSRIPQAATLQPGAPNTLLPLPAQGQIVGQTPFPGVPNSAGSNPVGSSSITNPPSGAPFVPAVTTPPIGQLDQTTAFQTNSYPSKGKISTSRLSGLITSSANYSGSKLPVTPPRRKARGGGSVASNSFSGSSTVTPDFNGSSGKTQPMDDNAPAKIKDSSSILSAGTSAGSSPELNADGTQKFGEPILLNGSGETTPNTSTATATNTNNPLSNGYANNIATGTKVVDQIVKFREQYKNLATAASIDVTSDSGKITGIVYGGMVIKNKEGEVDIIELVDGSKPSKEVRDAVLGYLQKNPIAAINGRPTYVSFRISPKSGDTTTQTQVKPETNQSQQPVVIPSSTVPNSAKPVKVEVGQQNNSTTTSEPLKPIDKLRQRVRELSKNTESESSPTQVVTQEISKPTGETEVKPFLNKLRQYRDQKSNSNQ
jgi:hypothetical protein